MASNKLCLFCLVFLIPSLQGSGIPGGPTEWDLKDPRIAKYTEIALAHINGNGANKELVEVTKASSQVVSGSLTKLTMKLKEKDYVETCEISIWEQPWLNKTEVTNVDCKSSDGEKRVKRSDDGGGQVLGGPTVLDLKDPRIPKYTEIALSHLNGNGANKELVQVKQATMQVVSGTLTKLIIEVKEKDYKETCKIKIWEQSWLNRTEVTDVDCIASDLKKKVKRSADGGSTTLLDEFNEFMIRHNKVYADKKEYKKRYLIYKANLKKIQMLRETEQGDAEYGVNWFADLSQKEFKQYLGLKKPSEHIELPKAEIPNVKIPDEFDWRYYNVVTPVKNQQQCGSCWAFSVTGNIEGQWALKKGELLSLSEQELVDCDTMDDGCNGGYMTQAYQSIVKLGGLETEKDYPYDAEDEKCKLDRAEVKVRISGGVNITSNETAMAQWLFKNGPMSVAVNANAMQFYMGGVSHPFKFLCNPQDLDHGVLVVGYGVRQSKILKKTLPYWIVKNSWGTRWGELGYYKLYRGDGSCGINQMVSSAVI